MNNMVPHKTLGVLCIRILDQGSDAGPGGQNIPATYIDVRGEVILHLVEDELDILLTWAWTVSYRARCVGGASNGEPLPREEKDDPTITGGRVKEAHADGRIVIWEHDVYAGRGTDNVAGLSVVHLPDGVGEGSGRIDHTFGFYLKFLP